MKLERVQKNACRNILKEKYESYENSLRILCIDSLFQRREKLLLAFGRKCLRLEQTKELFPLNDNIDTLKLRTRGKYRITETNTERFKNSTVPSIQRILNEKRKTFQSLIAFTLVYHDCKWSNFATLCITLFSYMTLNKPLVCLFVCISRKNHITHFQPSYDTVPAECRNHSSAC